MKLNSQIKSMGVNKRVLPKHGLTSCLGRTPQTNGAPKTEDWLKIFQVTSLQKWMCVAIERHGVGGAGGAGAGCLAQLYQPLIIESITAVV